MQIPLREAKRMVRSQIQADQKYDEERLVDTIHLGILLAWNSGKWWRSMDRLLVQVRDGRIVLPEEYGVLLAINYENLPRMIHNVWYEFSPNGPGTRDCWEHRGIFDLQTTPTHYRIQKGEKVVAISKSKIGEDFGTAVVIQGRDTDGNEIYRYCNTDKCGELIRTSNSGEEIRVSYLQENKQPSPAYATHSEFTWDGITAILKEQTIGPIEIMAIGPRYARPLVTMAPGSTQSSLRAYRVPESCRCGAYAEVLAKKAEPPRPYHDDEILLIESPNALIDLCLSVYYSYYTSYDPARAAQYLTSGIAHLNGQLQEYIGSEMQLPKVWTSASYARHKKRVRNAY